MNVLKINNAVNAGLVSAALRMSIPLRWPRGYLNMGAAGGMLKQVQHDVERVI